MTVHVMAQQVQVGTIVRQRCAWCGEIILDDDCSNMFSIDGRGPMAFTTGAFVEVHGYGKSVVATPPDGQPPPGFCGAPKPKLSVVK